MNTVFIKTAMKFTHNILLTIIHFNVWMKSHKYYGLKRQCVHFLHQSYSSAAKEDKAESPLNHLRFAEMAQMPSLTGREQNCR